MLISLRKYLYGWVPAEGDGEYARALAAAVRQIVRDLAQNLLLDANADLKRIKREILKIEEGLESATSPAEIEQLGSRIGTILGAYRAGVLELEQARAAAVQNMISSLQETVVALSGGNRRAVVGMRQIEKELMRAAAIEDIVALRSRLFKCLQMVREETARERDEVARNLLLMHEAITRAGERVAALRGHAADRAEAELLLRDERPGACPQFTVVFRLERFDSIASRFGEAAASETMEYFEDCLKNRIEPPLKLFRWNEAAIVALLERSRPKWEVIAEIQSVDWSALEKRVEAGERVAVLSLSNQWAVFDRDEIDSREELIAGIDCFAGVRQD